MRSQNRQFGFTVGECIVALALLGTMLVTLLSIQVVQSLRIGLDGQRMRAEQTLGNLADRILAATSSELTDEGIATWTDEAEQAGQLPADTIQVVVTDESQPIAGKRYELIWQAQTKQLPQHRLVLWRFDTLVPGQVEDQP